MDKSYKIILKHFKPLLASRTAWHKVLAKEYFCRIGVLDQNMFQNMIGEFCRIGAQSCLLATSM